MEKKTFVIADIHGRATALKQVLKKAEFNPDIDTLINLGDVCDGGRQTKQCFDILLRIKNRVDTLGNHDFWAYNWMMTGEELPIWVHQGGYNTMNSYDWDRHNVPITHSNMIKNALKYYIDDKNRIYVHGGFNPKVPIENQTLDFVTWDRTLIKYAQNHKISAYTHVFVGHTTTQLIKSGWTIPLTFNNLTMVDCGGGWNGRLVLVNVDDINEYYSSDLQKPGGDVSPDFPDTEEEPW
jgi:serine/threonine protein phosphatase 1